MNTSQSLHGQFRQISGSIRERYGEITNDDVQQAEGSVEKLIGVVQEKTGHSRDQIEACVSEAGNKVRAGYGTATSLIAERPTESIVGAFAIGVAAGVALGFCLARSRRVEPSWRTAWRR